MSWDDSISEKDYHNSGRLGSSRLVDAARLTGIDYKLKYENEQERVPAFDFGSIYHMAVLEPKRFIELDGIAILPNKKRPTSAQLNAKKPSDATIELINFWADWDMRNRNKHHISQSDYDKVIEMVKVLKEHPRASQYLFNIPGQNEVTGHFELAGQKCQIRVDRLLHSGTLIDLKSSSDASLDAFKRNGFGWKEGEGYGYQTQGALYLDGAQQIEPRDDGYSFMWIVQEKTFPYKVAIYTMSKVLYEEGKREYQKGLQNHIKYNREQVWPGYPEEIQTIRR